VEQRLKTKGHFCAAVVALASMVVPVGAQNITPVTSIAVQRLLETAADPAVSMPVWNLRRDSPPADYVRNPVVWTGAWVDLTGKAVWNSFTGAYGTTAISPRHVVYADHVNGLFPTGTIVRFVANDNTTVERIVVSSTRIGKTDLDLSTLDSPLPETIHWFKVMPKGWFLHCTRRAPGIAGAMPCIVLDANTESVSVKDLAGFFAGGFATGFPADTRRRLFTRELRVGDSGSPMFILIDGQLVIDGIYSTAQGGVDLSSQIPDLNAAMKGSGFGVTTAQLSDLASR
jgi:hypothetical protein